MQLRQRFIFSPQALNSFARPAAASVWSGYAFLRPIVVRRAMKLLPSGSTDSGGPGRTSRTRPRQARRNTALLKQNPQEAILLRSAGGTIPSCHSCPGQACRRQMLKNLDYQP